MVVASLVCVVFSCPRSVGQRLAGHGMVGGVLPQALVKCLDIRDSLLHA